MTFPSRVALPSLIAFFLMSASFAIARDMFTKDYDADLDHHMYFGQRLLYGELIWTKEIYDKFPLIQYLFAIPAYFGSIRIWFVMSAAMLFLSASVLYMATPSLLKFRNGIFDRYTQNLCAIFVVSFYLFFSTIIPPSLIHINSITTSFLVLSIFIISILNSECIKSKFYIIILYFISALFASFAISIRPFFAIAVASLVFWLFFRFMINFDYTQNFTNSDKLIATFLRVIFRSLFNTFIWLILVILCFLITNFLPYIITHNEVDMIEGVIHNAQKLNPQSSSDIFLEQSKTIIYYWNWYYLFIFVTSVFILLFREKNTTQFPINTYKEKIINYFLKENKIDIIFGAIVPFLSLELMILVRHWWDHYWQMFVPLGIVYFIIFIRIFFRQYKSVNHISARIVRIIALCSFAVGAVLGASANQEAHHSQESKLKEITSFLDERHLLSRRIDFLDIGDMYSHWMLSESRHGFPHAQNMQHIILGWYSSLHRMQHIIFPYTREELCHQVIERGPSVVFMTFSYMFSCLLSKESGYLLERNSPELIIFVRDPRYVSTSDTDAERSLTK